MKSTKAAQGSVDVNNLSIPDAEEIIEEALNELAFSSDPGLARALRFLAPPGYQAIVELCSENGRSKRRNASSDTWSPEEDEVRIYFERVGEGEAAHASGAQRARPPLEPADEEDDSQEAVIPPIWTRGLRSCARRWPRRSAAGTHLSRSSGSATRSCRARRSAGISIRSRARRCWPRPSSAAWC